MKTTVKTQLNIKHENTNVTLQLTADCSHASLVESQKNSPEIISGAPIYPLPQDKDTPEFRFTPGHRLRLIIMEVLIVFKFTEFAFPLF